MSSFGNLFKFPFYRSLDYYKISIGKFANFKHCAKNPVYSHVRVLSQSLI